MQVVAPEDLYPKKYSLVIDIRPSRCFKKGSLPGAVSFPFNSEAPIDEYVSMLSQKIGYSNCVIYDDDGSISPIIAKKASRSITFLRGGYREFCNWREHTFEQTHQVIQLRGFTGSGKSLLLKEMSSLGFQVVNLEELAEHKGSVFGNTPFPQPSHETFQNLLLESWIYLDESKPVWIEEKSKNLGKVGIPISLQEKMNEADFVTLESPFEIRLDRIMEQYGSIPKTHFRKSLRSLEKRMGMSANHKALSWLDKGDMRTCMRLLLEYYDQTYLHRRNQQPKKSNQQSTSIYFDHHNISEAIAQLKKFEEEVMIRAHNKVTSGQ